MENTIGIIVIFIAVILMLQTVRDIMKRRLKLLAFSFIWLAIVVVFPIVGPVVYFLLRDNMSVNHPRKFNPKFR